MPKKRKCETKEAFLKTMGEPFMAPKKRKKLGNRKFKAALKELGLTVASQRTAKVLGVGVRHCQRLAAGEQAVPRPVEILLEVYRKHPKVLPEPDEPT
jgi:hypothetical protein